MKKGMTMKMSQMSIWVSAVVALLLLALNLAGLLLPIRNPSWEKADQLSRHGMWLSYQDALKIIHNGESLPAAEYVKLVNSTVHQSVIHYWGDDSVPLRVPAYRNYILFTASYIAPQYYRKYEFCNPRRGLERGIGLCSQDSIIVTGFLEERGIPTRVILLNGHVVAEATIDQKNNNNWIADPDYGVVIPYSIEAIEANPKMIRPFYQAAGYDSGTIDALVNIYGPVGNERLKDGITGYTDCHPIKVYISVVSYILIWIIPAGLLIPVIMLLYRRRKLMMK